eukprot:GFUD01022247.1.p1 GENE.GFUD01022247.1~~GFUD01022247.1.p1  ORF type:complete len:742 (-),score=173.54 GFUD01022247.1:248-2473(-)
MAQSQDQQTKNRHPTPPASASSKQLFSPQPVKSARPTSLGTFTSERAQLRFGEESHGMDNFPVDGASTSLSYRDVLTKQTSPRFTPGIVLPMLPSVKKQTSSFDMKFGNIPVMVTGCWTEQNKPLPVLQFSTAGLNPLLMENLTKSGYKVPTPVQKLAIPILMGGSDMIVCAQTGSGNTAAFLLPILHNLIEIQADACIGAFTKCPQCVVITPTRGLASQIFKETRKFVQGTEIRSAVAYVGTSGDFQEQTEQLGLGCNILIATPGGLMEYVDTGRIDFSSLLYLVLDEVETGQTDCMLKMPDFKRCMACPSMPVTGVRQTLMFSPSFSDECQRLAWDFLIEDFTFVTVGLAGGTSKKEHDLLPKQGRRRPMTLTMSDFIEGGGEHKTSANKKKVQKSQQSVTVDSKDKHVQDKVQVTVEAVDNDAKRSDHDVTEDCNYFNDAKSIVCNVEDKVEDAETESGDFSRYKEIADAIAKNVQDEFVAKKSKLDQLCNYKCELERAVAVELELLGAHKHNVEDLIGSKSEEIKNLILLMDKSEDEKNGKMKNITEVDTQLADLEARIIELKIKKADLVKGCDCDEELIQKLGRKQQKLEVYIENERKKAKIEENGIGTKIQNLIESLTETSRAIQNLPNQVITLPTVQPGCPQNQLLDFIDKEISEKEKELECPVCFEVAVAPIFMCSELHLICTNCRPRVKECPECRIQYEGKPKRHRYAEKTAEELDRLRNERRRSSQNQSTR